MTGEWMTFIVGIDPGSRKTGYGIIKQEKAKVIFVDAGVIYTKVADMPGRIACIFKKLSEILSQHELNENNAKAAIEQVFVAKNPDSALKLGQARGAAIAALTMNNLNVCEYSARQIKQAVSGYGAADKEQVSKMVQLLLKLDFVPQEDAADALACAICHAYADAQNQAVLLGDTAVLSPDQSKPSKKTKGRLRLSEDQLLQILTKRS